MPNNDTDRRYNSAVAPIITAVLAGIASVLAAWATVGQIRAKSRETAAAIQLNNWTGLFAELQIELQACRKESKELDTKVSKYRTEVVALRLIASGRWPALEVLEPEPAAPSELSAPRQDAGAGDPSL